MPVYPFQLSFSKSVHFIFLRELNGNDELMIEDPGTPGVLRLLNNIIVPAQGTSNEPVKAEKIVITDRDFILSGIYRYTYGSKIESSLLCQACSSRYDINFSLDDLEAHHKSNAVVTDMDPEGFFYTHDHSRFRLPNGEDELAVWGLPAEQAGQLILQRCLPEPVPAEKFSTIQETMEKIAPVLLTDVEVSCPECGQKQNAQFDIQSFLLNRLKLERKRVAMEVHCIATAYRWTHREILDLPRSLRQTYAALIGLN